jgi:hypothetical protein
MDLIKLTPAPWTSVMTGHAGCVGIQADGVTINNWSGVDAQFAVLARNAFDVMLRRGWGVEVAYEKPPFDEWRIDDGDRNEIWENDILKTWSDPFTALVEADKWYIAKFGK